MYVVDTEKYLLMMTGRHVEGTPLDKKMTEHADDLIPGIGNMNIDHVRISVSEMEREGGCGCKEVYPCLVLEI